MKMQEKEIIQLLKNINDEKEKQKRSEARKAKIEYEYNLYKNFCLLLGIYRNKYSSLKLFESYCKENNIKLL